MNSLTLNNGLRVVYAPSPTNTVYLGLALDAGTRDEKDGESGMAHFAEHLSFKGTDRRTSRQIITYMESVGGDLNAFTGKEETVYYCTCQKEHFSRAMDLLFDVVFHSKYPQEEMDKEVEVVIDEIESYNDSPSELIYDDFEAMLFQGHPLGRSILGNAERLRAYKTEDVQSYTSRLYVPSNAVLFVYGNVSEKEIMKQIRKEDPPQPSLQGGRASINRLSGHIGSTSYSPPYREGLGVGPVSGSHIIHKDTHQAHIMMGARAFGGTHPKHLALFLANNILGGPGLSSRLNLALREKRGLVYTVESTLTTYTDTGVWAIYFGCDHHDAEKCKRIVKRELQRLCDAPLSEKALNAAKRQIIGQIALSYDNFESVAIGMGKRMLHYGRTQTKEQFIDRIQALTAEQVWDAAREIFNPENLTILEYR
ncbi:MAG: insulinase family protein [Bacteroidaceae bacterium]|nr:insulinase family protein [Bacteroidaceae bacterium]MBQ1200197.1 insulinase family protein [Bacteroidaceae bacterium]